MKKWKWLMVTGVAVILVSGMLAAQFVNVTVDETHLEVDTQEAGLQIGASDGAVADEAEIMEEDVIPNYLLEYEEGENGDEGFAVNLGTWGAQNEFISTAAFFVANTNPEDTYISNVELDGAIEGKDYIDIYLHGDQHGRDLDGDYSIHAEEVDDDNYVHLAAGEGYDDTTLPFTDGSEATLEYYGEGEYTGEGYNKHWHVEQKDWDVGIGDTGDSNAVWVRIEVDAPSEEISDSAIVFETEDADPSE